MTFSDDEEYHYSDIEGEEQEMASFDEEEDDYRYSESESGSVTSTDAPESSSAKRSRTSSGTNTSSGTQPISRLLATQTQSEQQEYQVFDEKELYHEQHKLVEEVAQVLDIGSSVAMILLRHFGWNKERLFEGYYLDPAAAKEAAGVKYAEELVPSIPDDQHVMCIICCDTLPPKDMYGMGCGHLFCKPCWRSYLSLKVAEGPLCIMTTCPAHGCKEVVNDHVFREFTVEEDYQKYSRFLLRSYVDINKCVKWCPSPGCNKAISSSGGLSAVKCACGCLFCPRCGEEAHSPVTCEQLAAWQEKCRNESETANWILANTKKCPKCSVRIEKNQGCNHMTCRSCRHEFCWICLQDWSKHGANTGGYYKCNRYDDEGASSDTEVARAKAELDRYLHYYQRYANHSEAGKFAVSSRAKAEEKMIELQQKNHNTSWIDVQFLNAATEQLIECRRVLKYTYVLGYYLSPGKERDLFEYLQENLEKNTERLSELSELSNAVDRAEVINYTRVTERFLHNLLTGVEEGLTSDMPLV